MEKENEEGEEVRRPYLRAYRVFCADQIDGLDASFYRTRETAEDLGTESDATLDAWFGRLGARIETSDDPRAYFHPGRDMIHMPPIAAFHTTQAYYETLGHEGIHWTGGAARLDRIKRCRDRAAYAFEELVAEIGQCLLFAGLGLEPSIDQSAAYVEDWLKALKDDKKAIFRAASEAQKAVDFVTARCGALLSDEVASAA